MAINKPIRIYKNLKMFDNTTLIEIEQLSVNKTIQIDNIIKLYHDNTLVGINIFEDIFKDETDGFIYPYTKNLEILNKYLKPYDLSFTYNKDDYLKVGQVIDFEKIEGSSLTLCEVLVDDKVLNIVCGASNVEKDMKTIVALDNALLESGMRIKSGKVFGVDSDGMLCSRKELNLEPKAQESGIIKLDKDEKLNRSFFDIDWGHEHV